MVAEMLQADEETPAKLRETHSIPFKFNFMAGTSRNCKYDTCSEFHIFLNRAIRQIKRNDNSMGNRVDLHKRGRKVSGVPG